MPTLNIPIDFNLVRTTLVSAVAQGTGLPEGQVIMMEIEGVERPRPESPYFGVMITTPSVKSGMDWMVPVVDEPGQPTGLFHVRGQRSMSVSFDCFANEHELAFGLMSGWQAAIEQPPVRNILDQAGLSVEDVGAVSDLSALLAVSYEGRAHLDVNLSLMSDIVVDVGQIDSVPLTSRLRADGRVLSDQFTVRKAQP